jgi:hypothetical protein
VIIKDRLKMNKSSQVKPENLCFIGIETLLELADDRQSVWFTPLKQLRPAAFFQNWNARYLLNSLRNGTIMGVRRGILMGEVK